MPTPSSHSPSTSGNADPPLSVPVVAEIATVEKRNIDTGRGVRITKRVIEREEIVDEPLEHDELVVERVAVNQIVDAQDLPSVRQEGDVTIIPVLEEMIVIEKRILLKEEMRVRRVRRAVHDPQRVVLRSEMVTAEDFDENRTTPGPTAGRPAEPTAGEPAGEN